MPPPFGFSWIDHPFLAASARPSDPEELAWLRQQGIQLLISLTEIPLRRDWIDASGLLALHVPIIDMDAPSQDQLAHCVAAITRARSQNMGVVVHCTAGLGRTGTIVAAYLVTQGLSPREAFARIRETRPGSIETLEQELAVEEFSRRLTENTAAHEDLPQ